MPTSTTFYILLPTLFMFLGGIAALVRQPGPKLTSATQHFAAGVVFSAVAVELLPQIIEKRMPISLSIGFLLGLSLMIFIKFITGRIENIKGQTKKVLPLGMIIAVAVDLLIDGALISIAFAAGEKGGILIAIALTIETLFLGLSTSASLLAKNLGRRLITLLSALLAVCVLIGAAGGWAVITWLPHQWLNGILAFGVAALLYLVTEELLVEAHEVDETPLITSAFFIGFLCILLLDTQF